LRRAVEIVGRDFVTSGFSATFIATFVLFCRIGGCVMVAPGFSSERISIRIRLYIALATTFALAPPLLATVERHLAGADTLAVVAVVISEVVVGALLGLLSRLYFLALETLATAMAMTIGISNIFNQSVLDSEPAPSLAVFVVFCAITLVFVTDQHLEIIRGLFLSYETAPLAATPSAEAMVSELTRVLTQSHLLALRISSPFLLFGLLVNLAFGFLNRFTPQVPVYFVSGPFVIVLGLYGLYLAGPDFFTAFSAQFGAWLARG
jgi:flagellar biosynthetic protein FliR